jgi:hypothetical protein
MAGPAPSDVPKPLAGIKTPAKIALIQNASIRWDMFTRMRVQSGRKIAACLAPSEIKRKYRISPGTAGAASCLEGIKSSRSAVKYNQCLWLIP